MPPKDSHEDANVAAAIKAAAKRAAAIEAAAKAAAAIVANKKAANQRQYATNTKQKRKQKKQKKQEHDGLPPPALPAHESVGGAYAAPTTLETDDIATAACWPASLPIADVLSCPAFIEGRAPVRSGQMMAVTFCYFFPLCCLPVSFYCPCSVA